MIILDVILYALGIVAAAIPAFYIYVWFKDGVDEFMDLDIDYIFYAFLLSALVVIGLKL